MKKSFVIKKSFIITYLFISLLPLTLLSQTELMIEPSWDLPLKEQTNHKKYACNNMIETEDGFFVVPIQDIDEHRNCKATYANLVVIDNNGNFIKEITLQYAENYIVNNIALDIWNDTVNVFAHLISTSRDHSAIVHTYLNDDFTIGEHREICRNDFSDKERTEFYTMPALPLIDNDGNRTMFYRYRDWPEPSANISWFMMKFDSKLNLIIKKEYLQDSLETDDMDIRFAYNADSTQYYMMSRRHKSPYDFFINVFDMDLNLIGQIQLESDHSLELSSFNGTWSQNPCDGKIYGIGDVLNPSVKSEICAFKVDIEQDNVNMLQFTNTPSDFMCNIVHGVNNLCFLPNGNILGMAIWDVEDYFNYKPDAYYVYIPVFDTSMKKQSEWFYTIGKEYNQLLSQIYLAKDNGIVLTGNIRFKIDEEILWEPYIVKFPASAFDPDNIEEAHAHGLHLAAVYPNPGGDVMNIRTALRNATLQVYDIQGRIVHEQEITDDVTSIDVSKWTNGTYVWKLGMRNEKLGMKEVESGKWIKGN